MSADHPDHEQQLSLRLLDIRSWPDADGHVLSGSEE